MNKQKGLAPILIVILIALTIGGYLIYQKQVKPVSVPQQTPQSSPVTDQNLEAKFIVKVIPSGKTDTVILQASDNEKIVTVPIDSYIYLRFGVGNYKYSINPTAGILEIPQGKYNLPNNVIGQVKAIGVGTAEIVVTKIMQDETVNWKTYKNEKYKYQFNYPTDWDVQTLGDSEVYISDQKLDIKNGMDSPSLQYDLIDISYISSNQIDMKVTAPVGTQQKLSQFIYIQKISDLNIGGRPGAKIIFIDQQNSNKRQPQTAYWISLDNGKLQVSATSSAKLKIIDQILYTFKFTK